MSLSSEVVMVEVTEVAVRVAATAEAMMVEVRAVVMPAMCRRLSQSVDAVMTKGARTQTSLRARFSHSRL